MKILIKDLGAIKEAEIDLSKKLTIFCGPNGTGKTYMGFAIFALTTLKNKSIGMRMEREKIENLIEKNEVLLDIDTKKFFNYRQNEIKKINNNLWNLFAVDESKSKEYFKNTLIAIEESEEAFNENLILLEINFDLKIFNYNFKIIKQKNELFVKIELAPDIIKDEDFRSFIEIAFLTRIYSILAYYPITNSTILPVERNSFYTFVKELSVRKNDAFDYLESISQKKDYHLLDVLLGRKTRYPQPIREGLEIADDLSNIKKRTSTYCKFADDIENTLLKGKVIVSDDGDIQFSSDKARSKKLSFHQSSSIVKTLASLVIYLRHLASENDLIIIDEPELNLHPNNQVLLARIFAKLINNGLRLVISTHSDYIVREFNNLIMASADSDDIKDLIKELGYEESEKLSPEVVGAYMFNFKNNSAKQLTVKQLEIDKFGFEVSTFDQTIDELNKRSDQLYFTLKYGKAE